MSFEMILGIIFGIAQVGGLVLGLWLGHRWFKKRKELTKKVSEVGK